MFEILFLMIFDLVGTVSLGIVENWLWAKLHFWDFGCFGACKCLQMPANVSWVNSNHFLRVSGWFYDCKNSLEAKKHVFQPKNPQILIKFRSNLPRLTMSDLCVWSLKILEFCKFCKFCQLFLTFSWCSDWFFVHNYALWILFECCLRRICAKRSQTAPVTADSSHEDKTF